MVFIDTGQELEKSFGLFVFCSRQVYVDHVKNEDAENENWGRDGDKVTGVGPFS